MSFLGPFEALWPIIEPFTGSRPVGQIRQSRQSFIHPTRLQHIYAGKDITTWEKDNSVKVSRVTYGRNDG